MDYLRTLGSAAVSTLVQKSGLNLPFSLGTKVTSFENIWTLYDGTKRDDGSPVSIFEYDFNDPARKRSMPLAKNALRKLRTTRHPDVLKFMDAIDTDSVIYIMTERVRPLTITLEAWSSRGATEREDWLLWGLHRISVALAFVNDSCSSTHGNLRVNSIFISPSGEWKLGGFELLSNPKEEAAVLYTLGGTIPDAPSWASPEVKKGGYSALKDHDPAAADSYALGLLLHAVFNPSLGPPATSLPPHPPPPPSSRGSIPTAVFSSFKRLLNPNPKARMTCKTFLEVGMAETAGEGSGFFANNRLVKVCMGLDNFSLGSEAEKNMLLRTLKESQSTFPTEFASYRVLPNLVTALEYGGASAAAILPLVLQLGKNIPPEEYPNVIISPLCKLFASPDRGIRMALLDHLPEFSEKLDKKIVADKIWPHLQTGFTDTVAIIREATVKSIILLSPKINDRILNNDLLRHLARMQTDPEASIRTNTCILIGRLGPALGFNTKRKVLVPAFSRALKDPFVHARVAGLMSFMATIDCFEVEELATKVIPNMSYSLVDKEKLVREQAFKAIELFVKKLETHAASMPEAAAPEESIIPGAFSAPIPTQATLVNTAAGAAGALAGWAISSLGKTLATADMQSMMSSVSGNGIERPTSTPPSLADATRLGDLRQSALLTVPSTLSAANSAISSPVIPTSSSSRAKGMQLGANKIPASVASAALAAQLADEVAAAEGIEGNPWGTDDLIDINADDGDWSAFESASPLPSVEPRPVSPGFGGVSSQNGTPGPASHHLNHPWATVWGESQPAHPDLATQPRKASPSLTDVPPISGLRTSRLASSLPPGSGGWDSADTKSKMAPTVAAGSTAGLSKEDKAAEMARRKEERKQRIAHLKEQKKNAKT